MSKEEIVDKLFEGYSDYPSSEKVFEAMDIHSKLTAVAFAEWILKESVLPRDTNWFDAGKHYTTEQLYDIFKSK